jgi:heme-degrading monooxygenase HmoA
MIARRWTAVADGRADADSYVAFFERTVRLQLDGIAGFLGDSLERVERDGEVELVVITRWESMEAIRAFAGDDVDRAVVEPEAQAVLAASTARSGISSWRIASGSATSSRSTSRARRPSTNHGSTKRSPPSTTPSSGSGWWRATSTGTGMTTRTSSSW